MSKSVSFLRRITFKAPTARTPLWIKQADLYEDENRIYAFLTFSNSLDVAINKCKIRILPFDKEKYGMDPFGIRILNLGLKGKMSKEHNDPLILPKGTYGFNFSIISYGTKKEEDVVPTSAASPSIPKQEAPVSSNVKQAETAPSNAKQETPIVPNLEGLRPINEGALKNFAENLGGEKKEEAAQKTDAEIKPNEPKEISSLSNFNSINPIAKFPALLPTLLALCAIALGVLLYYSAIWGVNLGLF